MSGSCEMVAGTLEPLSVGKSQLPRWGLGEQQKETERDFRTQLLWCVGPAGVERAALGALGGWLRPPCPPWGSSP